jgi:hypothetical protein
MSLGPAKKALTRAITVAEANPWCQQFGQANDDAVWNGQTGCTHAMCQFLALLWFGQHLTLDQVNHLAGMPYRPTTVKVINGKKVLVPRGMNNLELQRFFNATGLPYVVRFGLPFETVLTYSNRAPVFYGDRYGSEPTQKGFVYHGAHARPPYATLNGATQLTGSLINGRHAVLLLGYRSVISDATGRIASYRAWRKDPNHGSSARPEKPPYDLIKTTEAKAEYLAYRGISKGRTYAALPTRSLPL